MTLRDMIFGTPVRKAVLAEKDAEYQRTDKRLDQLASARAEMRQKLGEAMQHIIEDRAK